MGLGSFLKKAVGVGGSLIGAGIGAFAGPGGMAAGFQIGGAIGGAVAGASAASSEKKAARAQRRQAQLQAWQNSMESLREFQRAQAMSSTAFQASGASLESSGAQGVRSSLGATEASNQALLGQNVQFGNQYYKNLQDAASMRGAAAIGSAIASIGSSVSSLIPTTPAPTTTTTTSGPPPIRSTGTRVWNPQTGTYEAPKGFGP
jgi:hypothetical protein